MTEKVLTGTLSLNTSKQTIYLNHMIIATFLKLCEKAKISVLQMHTCGRSSLTNEKDHRYFLNRFVCVGEFFDGGLCQF